MSVQKSEIKCPMAIKNTVAHLHLKTVTKAVLKAAWAHDNTGFMFTAVSMQVKSFLSKDLNAEAAPQLQKIT